MNIRLLIVFLLVISGFNLNAQYVNTDELVIVPGHKEPLSLTEYEIIIRESMRGENVNFLCQFLVPGNSGYVISRFGPRSGRMHYGTDIKMNKGDTVIASNKGYVERVAYVSGFGNLVVIRHENNLQTYYAHLSKFLVKQGTWTEKGKPIGLAGSTGRARGNHLHFEIREKGMPFDPELLFDFKNLAIRETAAEAKDMAHLHRILKPRGYSANAAIPEYYKVKSGDSLWAISRRYKTSVKQICQLNNISENTVLRIGQPLKMY